MTFFGTKFMKQKMMRKVVYSLIPIIVASIVFFGWRSLFLLISTTFFGVFAEWIFKRKTKKPISEAVFVSCVLYTLTLPPRTPFWIAAVGIIFGIVFGKEVFGGFGRNVFNPALVGRAFIYVSFPKFMTAQWTASNTTGIMKYLNTSIDTLSSATPMLLFKSTGEMVSYGKLLFGNVAGSLGETSAVLIILAGIYLIYTKTAAWETIVSMLGGFLITNTFFYMIGVAAVPNPLFGLLSGGVLFGAVFMATDPISSPKEKNGKFIYGILIGIITVVIRGFALFAGGVMFAILIGNTFAPIIDETVKAIRKRKKERGAVNG